MNVADLGLLIDYNQWANSRILQPALRLTPKQLNAPHKLSHGSAFQGLLHLVDVEWSWRHACQVGQFPTEILSEKQLPDLKVLRRFWLDEMRQMSTYVRSLSDSQVNAPIRYSWARARPREKTLWHVLAHVVNHGTQHRAELGWYLAQCGQAPGDLDFILFVSKRPAGDRSD